MKGFLKRVRVEDPGNDCIKFLDKVEPITKIFPKLAVSTLAEMIFVECPLELKSFCRERVPQPSGFLDGEAIFKALTTRVKED